MYGIAWIAGALVAGSSVVMGTFNGAHMLGLIVMAAVTVAWWRKDVAAWRRFQAIAAGVADDVRVMDAATDLEAFRSVR